MARVRISGARGFRRNERSNPPKTEARVRTVAIKLLAAWSSTA
jgi:hypothetical protein